MFDLIDVESDGDYVCKTWVNKAGQRTEEKNAPFRLTVATRPMFDDVPRFIVGKIGED